MGVADMYTKLQMSKLLAVWTLILFYLYIQRAKKHMHLK